MKRVQKIFQQEVTESFPRGIKCWYDPTCGNIQSGARHNFDIVFIHGLTGDREATWTHPEEAYPWPPKVIPQYFPDARLLTYGYDAYPVRMGFATQTKLHDHAQDFLTSITSFRSTTQCTSLQIPTIFVVHSLGGLLIKKALVLSHMATNRSNLLVQNTQSILFMGTPHKGSWLARWATISVRALGIAKSSNMSLLKVLQTGDDILIELHGNFLRVRRQVADSSHLINIYSFMETLPQKRRLVVSPSSARLDEDTDVSIMKNHSDLTKFRSSVTRMSDSSFDSFIHFMEESSNCIRARQTQMNHGSMSLEDNEVQVAYIQSMPREELEKECIESFSFPELGSKMAMVEFHELGTCQWIYDEPSFCKWNNPIEKSIQDPHYDILVLRGIPGSGKSTLVKYLYRDYRERRGSTRPLRLNFFFNATGVDLEKSPTGLYMSLLTQLLASSPKARGLILSRFVQKKASTSAGKVKWSSWELRDLVFTTLTDRTFAGEIIAFYLDALDECSQNMGQRVANEMEKLTGLARSSGVQIMICMSTRDYSCISLRHCLELHLETQNASDIRLVTQNALDSSDLEIFKESIVNKAAGNFLWARIVISRLQQFASHGQTSPAFLETFLHDTPEELKAMFARIVLSMTPEQRSLTSTMLQWIMSACRPLTIRELAYATALTATPRALSLRDFINFRGVNYSDERSVEKFVSFTTCGLLRNWTSRHRFKPVLGFVHQTVRDFILGDGLQLLGFETHEAFTEISRRTIAQSILRLSIQPEIAQYMDTGFDGYSSIGNRFALANYAGKIPLTEYLIYHIFDHFPETLWTQPLDSVVVNEQEFSYLDSRNRILSLWTFLDCLITHEFELYRQYDHSYWRKTHRFLDYACGLGTTAPNLSSDFGDLMIRMNNRNLFLRDLALDRITNSQTPLTSDHTYYQYFWVPGGVNGANRMIEALTDGDFCLGVTATKAMQICQRHASGLAFVARFKFSFGAFDPRRQTNTRNCQAQGKGCNIDFKLDSWIISTEIGQWEDWGLPDCGLDLSPLHDEAEGAGYISLLLESPSPFNGENWKAISVRYCEDDTAYRSPVLAPRSPVSSIASHRAEMGAPFGIVLPLVGDGANKDKQPAFRIADVSSDIEVNDDATSWTSRHSSRSSLYGPRSSFARTLRGMESASEISTEEEQQGRRQSVESWISHLGRSPKLTDIEPEASPN